MRRWTTIGWVLVVVAGCGDNGSKSVSKDIAQQDSLSPAADTAGLQEDSAAVKEVVQADLEFDVKPDICVPDCDGKECGNDGCGGQCGQCWDGYVCLDGGTCMCVPNCEGKQCGTDGCGGDCASCPEEFICIDAVCEPIECQPDCQGKQCGSDGCEGSCGTCGQQELCEEGKCVCQPACADKECGDDGCDGVCGACEEGAVCVADLCCTPGCEGKVCGDDGCGGDCGECEEGTCLEGSCCIPQCEGKECGDNGCSGVCGVCPGMSLCEDGICTFDPAFIGCSDGTREGFLALGAYPLIAACGGAWDVPGIHNVVPACGRAAGNTGDNPMGQGCNVTDLCAEGWHVCLGKDDVLYRSELGCTEIMDNAQSPAFFLTRTSSTGAFNCAPDVIGDPSTVNDIFGCGDLGCPANEESCEPLQLGSHDGCKALKNEPTTGCQCYFKGELPPTDPKYVEGDFENVVCSPQSGGCGWCKPLDYFNKLLGVEHEDVWDCGSSGAYEAENVIKTDPYGQGGVICCKDQCLVDMECGEGMQCIMSTCQEM
jgi:hypothetical protein